MTRTDIANIVQQYIDAELAVLQGKPITFNGQQMTMENLSSIVAGRKEWERRLSNYDRAERGGAPYKVARFG